MIYPALTTKMKELTANKLREEAISMLAVLEQQWRENQPRTDPDSESEYRQFRDAIRDFDRVWNK